MATPVETRACPPCGHRAAAAFISSHMAVVDQMISRSTARRASTSQHGNKNKLGSHSRDNLLAAALHHGFLLYLIYVPKKQVFKVDENTRLAEGFFPQDLVETLYRNTKDQSEAGTDVRKPHWYHFHLSPWRSLLQVISKHLSENSKVCNQI